MKKKPAPQNREEEILDDIQQYSALEAMHLSEGGLALVQSHLQDIVNGVETLGMHYRTLSHIEMIAIAAEMKTKLDMVRVLTRSTEQKELAQEALKESLSS